MLIENIYMTTALHDFSASSHLGNKPTRKRSPGWL